MIYQVHSGDACPVLDPVSGTLLTKQVLNGTRRVVAEEAGLGDPVLSAQIGDQSPHQTTTHTHTRHQADCMHNNGAGERQRPIRVIFLYKK